MHGCTEHVSFEAAMLVVVEVVVRLTTTSRWQQGHLIIALCVMKWTDSMQLQALLSIHARLIVLKYNRQKLDFRLAPKRINNSELAPPALLV